MYMCCTCAMQKIACSTIKKAYNKSIFCKDSSFLQTALL